MEGKGGRQDPQRQAMGLLKVGAKACSIGEEKEKSPEKTQQRALTHACTHTENMGACFKTAVLLLLRLVDRQLPLGSAEPPLCHSNRPRPW